MGLSLDNPKLCRTSAMTDAALSSSSFPALGAASERLVSSILAFRCQSFPVVFSCKSRKKKSYKNTKNKD